MAYAALCSLKRSIERIKNCSKISHHPTFPDILESALEELYDYRSLVAVTTQVRHSLRTEIAVAKLAYRLEDALDTHVSDQFISQYESLGDEEHPLKLSLDSNETIPWCNVFLEVMKVLKARQKKDKEDEGDEEDKDDEDNEEEEEDEEEYNEEEDEDNEEEYNEEEDEDNEEEYNEEEGEDNEEEDDDNDDEEEEDEDEDEDNDQEECSEDHEESSNPSTEENDSVSSTIDFARNKSKRVGLHDEFNKIKDLLTETSSDSSKLQVVSLEGMVGIGKTFLAMKILEDQSILSHFERVVFVTIGLILLLEKKVMLTILTQLNHDIENINMQSDEDLRKHLRTSLEGRRYLIVLDDIWLDAPVVDIKNLLPDDNNGSRLLITTRFQFVADQHSGRHRVHRLRFMNKEESWNLLRVEVFGEENLCPYQLEQAGKKIAEKCEGLPLLIVTIARLLSKAEKTSDYWNKVVDQKENSVFSYAYDEASKVLYTSYKYLPRFIKPCFLYMGVFPPNSEIPASKLVNLWSVEGFMNEDGRAAIDLDLYVNVLATLTSFNVVIVRQVNSSTARVKTCSLHSVFWYLCVKQARKEKIFHAIDSYAASMITEELRSQRRLCIYNNILFSIKDVNDSIESISTTRSLVCTGKNHQYPLPICIGLRLLRVLDALTIRFYEFPFEVLKFFHLTYLALTWKGELPASISKLWNLQYLIIHQHLSIKSCKAPSYLPMEIWDMVKLSHLQVIGSDLPEPNPCSDACLPNLSSLLNVSARSCTKGILERIPNLKRLGIQIEVAPDAAESFSCFNHMSCLSELESLKCVIVNPGPVYQVVTFPASPEIFPSNLTKLSLNGCGYPWEYMRVIASLQNLKVLKLRSYAFQGPEWKLNDGEFKELRTLLVEDTDLVHCIVDENSNCLPSLEHLIVRHCYKLKEIPLAICNILPLHMIELEDCPLAVPSAKKIQEQQPDTKNEGAIELCIHSSWENSAARKFSSASKGSQCSRCCYEIGKLERLSM